MGLLVSKQWIQLALASGEKGPGSEANRSRPPSAENKNAWTSTPTPPYTFMRWCMKHRDILTFA